MEEEEWLDIFTNNLIGIMEQNNWSQTDLSKYIGVSVSKINKVLQGKQLPSIKFINNLAYVSGVSMDDLIFFDEMII